MRLNLLSDYLWDDDMSMAMPHQSQGLLQQQETSRRRRSTLSLPTSTCESYHTEQLHHSCDTIGRPVPAIIIGDNVMTDYDAIGNM